MSNVNNKTSWFALVIGHMCGMIDLAALPVWVGTLIAGYGFLPAQAGGLATLFLAAVVICSLVLAPRFHKLNGRWIAPAGFWISAACFLVMSQIEAFAPLAVLHFVAGAATGLGISFTHGTMGKTSNPHRIFAFGGLALGIVAILYLGVTPQLISQMGFSMLFYVFAGVMGFAAVVTTLFFPNAAFDTSPNIISEDRPKFSANVWLVIFAIMAMALNSAMIFSFAERVGVDRGFGADHVQLALVTMGIIAVFPSLFAVVLQNRFAPMTVAMIGAVLHGAVALGMMTATDFPMFMAALIPFPFIMVFTHTFVFGHLAKIEPTGRAVAGTPAMIMTGSAVGPLLGGTVVQTYGYGALGILAFAIAVTAMMLFWTSTRQSTDAVPQRSTQTL